MYQPPKSYTINIIPFFWKACICFEENQTRLQRSNDSQVEHASFGIEPAGKQFIVSAVVWKEKSSGKAVCDTIIKTAAKCSYK